MQGTARQRRRAAGAWVRATARPTTASAPNIGVPKRQPAQTENARRARPITTANVELRGALELVATQPIPAARETTEASEVASSAPLPLSRNVPDSSSLATHSAPPRIRRSAPERSTSDVSPNAATMATSANTNSTSLMTRPNRTRSSG